MDTLRTCLAQEGLSVESVGLVEGHKWSWPGHLLKFLYKLPQCRVLHLHIVSNWKGRYVLYIGVLAGRLAGKRVVATFHSGNLGRFNAVVRGCYRHTHGVSIMCQNLYQRFVDWHFSVVLIPNIISNKEAFTAKEKLHPNFICTRNHVNRTYRLTTIIKAYEVVRDTYPEAVLFLVGNGRDTQKLKEWVQKRRTPDVVFLGKVSNDKIYDKLRLGDIYLNASVTDALPISVIEAMNAGALVISTHVGGIPDMIRDGETGYLVPVNDWQQMAQKALYALEHPDEALQIIRNARASIPSYQWPAIRQKMAQLYGISFS